MAYKKSSYDFGEVVEIEEYHTGRYRAPGQKRRKKSNPTPASMERVNQRKREDRCRWKIRANFKKGDYMVTMTFEREQRPKEMAEAKKMFEGFRRRVNYHYKKRGAKVKWIRNIEVGFRGAWHIHLVINHIEDTKRILESAWEHGHVRIEKIGGQRDYQRIASYITKTPRTDSRLKEASYSTSHDLPIPEPKVTIYHRRKTWSAEPKPKKGFYVEKDSVYEGVNPFTGYGYRRYTLFRL